MGSFSRRQFKGIEVVRVEDDARGFAPHFHDEFVLSVNVRGLESITLDKQSFDAAAGDVTLYNPAQIQSSRVVSEPWQFVSMYVDPTVLPELAGVSAETVFDKPLLRAPLFAARMHGAIRSALDRATPDGVALEGLTQIFGDLLKLAGASHAADTRCVPAAVGRIAERLRDDPVLPSLTDLASDAGLTPVQLVRAFSRPYGMPPLAWSWNLRVSQARARIARGDSISAVAMDLGFSDQSHLTRRFRALFGVPPSQWRKG